MVCEGKISRELRECKGRITHDSKHYGIDPAMEKSKGNENNVGCWSSFLGVFYAFMSSITLLISSVFVKKLTYIDSGQLSFIRNVGVFVGCIPIAIYCTKSIFGPKEYILLLLIRSFFGATSLYLILMAYRLLPLTETSIILSTVPALVTVVARFHLKEPCGFAQVTSIILTFLGVLMSLRLPEILQNRSSLDIDENYILGLSCAVGGAVILALIFVALRKMKNVHFSIVDLYFGFIGALENAVILYFTAEIEWPRCEGLDRWEVTMIGVFGFLGHSFLTLAFQKENAGVISTCKSASDIIFSIIFQLLFFNSELDYYTLVGGLLVIIAITLLSVWKWLLSQPEDSVYKKRFKCLLL